MCKRGCLLPGSDCELSMNEWESHKHLRKQEHTDTRSGLYLRSRLGWGKGSHYAQLGSGCGKGPTKTSGLLKPPWMSPRGQWSGRNAGLGLEVQGYVLLLMRSPRWASLALSPRHCLTSHHHCHKTWIWTTESCHTDCTMSRSF